MKSERELNNSVASEKEINTQSSVTYQPAAC